MSVGTSSSSVDLSETVTAAFGKPVVHVKLNRPDHRNPLDRVTVARLAEIVRAVDADPVARVAVIRGAGGHLESVGII